MSEERIYPGDQAMAAIAAAIGEAEALKLASRFGGVRLYVPRIIGDNHPICVAIGRTAADRLATYAGGSAFDIPKQAARRARVRQLRQRRALTISQIALQTSYTERHVYRILRDDSDSNSDRDQLDLFDKN